ncbi:carbonic anhydrase [Photobacterium galatheae]|uniref:carbonic anhydrase n=1 Tax=Photobacterium galatheae TaxID=1654360 RepID=UPI0006909DEB|nr:carbonic anhydrase family protein [Photobacterium galatheae]MCM0150452.1 carbonic anhydrase family protein [Photobacterium galatheae]
MKAGKIVQWAGLLIGLQSVSVVQAADHSWGYEGVNGPEHWAALSGDFATCAAGKNQSPIDLVAMVEGKLPPLSLYYQPASASVIDNGHTVQVNYAPGSSLTLDGQSFELKQFHFHTPSENHIRGKSFPLEGHFVHADKSGNLAVIAVMFQEGEANEALAKIWSQMPSATGKVVSLNQKVDVRQIIPAQQDYYRFSGSLTTPPCTEGVRWIVLKQPQTVSASQIEAFYQVLGHGNNRPVQPVNGRLVVSS